MSRDLDNDNPSLIYGVSSNRFVSFSIKCGVRQRAQASKVSKDERDARHCA